MPNRFESYFSFGFGRFRVEVRFNGPEVINSSLSPDMSYSYPSIVWVFPEPVYPYAKSVQW